jgi:hypothetical protein
VQKVDALERLATYHVAYDREWLDVLAGKGIGYEDFGMPIQVRVPMSLS